MTLRLNGSNSGFTEVKAPATAGSNTITLPTSNGSAEQFLKNSGTAGTLEYSSMVETSTGVGIGETSPLGKCHIKSGDSGVSSVGASADELVIEGSGHAGMTILSGDNQQGIINFGETDGNNIGGLTYSHGDNDLVIRTNSAERVKIHGGGKFRVPGVYNGTTTGGSAVYVESDGDMLRFTSSLKYKTDVETIEDARADAILNCRPVWYRSKCENDIKTEGSEKSDWGWYGFIAEEVAEIEPRLVNWATKDAVKQEDGSLESVERDPAGYEAEGVRYDNFVPLLVNLVKRQQTAIETLEAKVAALEAA